MTDQDPTPAPEQRRRPAALLGVAAVLAGLVLAAAAAIFFNPDGHAQLRAGPPPPRVALPETALPGPARFASAPAVAHRRHGASRHATARRPARPVRIIIPAIGVRATVIRLGLQPDGTLQTPTDFAQAGWWSGGPRPGERGAAVIVGHVDSKVGPGAFYALRSVRRGDAITTVGADGRSHHFVVQRLQSFPKAKFPTNLVYGATRARRLRLITCSGTFDQSTGHYLDNTVVFARPR
ncbi:MAG: Conserved putative secreted protein [Conexibacter sp.]|nr:Conserved putative secreted protein [Conexibacter sp.]